MCELLKFRHCRKRTGKIAIPAIDCGRRPADVAVSAA